MSHEAPPTSPHEKAGEPIPERLAQRLMEFILSNNKIDEDVLKHARFILSKAHEHVAPEIFVHTVMERYVADTQHPSRKLLESFELWETSIKNALSESVKQEWAATVCQWMLDGTYDDHEAELRTQLGAQVDETSMQEILTRAYDLYGKESGRV